MKTRVPCSLGFTALLLILAAEGFAFLPLACSQAAQVEAASQTSREALVDTQRLRGHVPAVLAHLQPIGRLAAGDRLKLAIELPLRNPEALARFLQQLHDPAHPNYRHYLTPEEFIARFGPTDQDYAAVAAFAQANGLSVTARHPNRTLLDVEGSVADIENTLHLTLGLYQHPTEARRFYAPEVEPSLDLAVPVLGISGLNNYSLPRPRLQATLLFDQQPAVAPNAGSGPSGTYMGNDFRAAYVPGSPRTGAGQTVGLLQFDGYAPSDIAYYESQAGLPSVPLNNVLLDGFSGNPTGSGGEVEVCLDIEASISMAPGLAGVVVYMAGPYGNFHDVLNRMATDNLAKQLSCSWYIPGGGADAVADQIFQQMAAQGQSFFNASGDYAAFTSPVDFPGETPYIVQVGGTTLTTSGPGGAWVSEKVWNWGGGIGSGGGISTRYTIPSYQADISMTLNQGSTTMRNIPDVALTADNVYVRANGRGYNVGGTSCAAPLWAGFTALVNQQAVGSGRPVVGFINPAVDAIGHASSYTSCFHDITTGDNTRSGSSPKFFAVAGYDLCTGWGTPGGQSLINALATPDALLITPSALAFSGLVGGPFSPNPGWLTLTNSGTNALSWTLVNTSAWFNVSLTSGRLVPGGTAVSVAVSVAPSVGALTPGVYTAIVALTNQTSGVAQTCSLAVSVAGLGMSDNFDPAIDLSQWLGFGGVVGSTVLATNYGGSVSASNSLWFGNVGSRFATTIPINTSGGGQIGFCIRLANGSAWPWAQPDNLPSEGVVLECSTNGGGSWTIIGNYDTPAFFNWTGEVLPIPAVAEAPATLFRWRQLSNSGTNYDHWALDNVVVGTGPIAPRIVKDPQSQNAAAGDPASLNVAAVGTPPLSYQWVVNGTNINGATGSSIAWTKIQLMDAGTYSVLISNIVGSVMSSNAILTVYVPVCAPPASGLVSWWAAEGDSSDVLGANNGVLQGGAGFVGGRIGQAFSFDQESGTMIVPDSSTLRLTNQLTIEAWINARTTSGPYGNAIISKVGGAGGNNGYQFFLDGNTLAGQFNSPGEDWPSARVTSGGLIATGVWYHVAWTYDQSTMKLYVNGALVANSVIGPQPIAASSSNLHISGDDNNHVYFDGLIDEASVYSRALSASEIAAIYNAVSAGKCRAPSPPSISVQPQSQTVAAGTRATLSVAATGSPPLSYQWRLDGTNIPAATGFALAFANIQLTDAGTYDVVVTNLYGSTNSSTGTLTVLIAPQITGQPQDQIVGVGSNVTFSITATGSSPLAYEWYFNGTALGAGTNSILALNGVALGQAGAYFVSVSNRVGSVISRTAILSVQGNGSCAAPPSGLVSWWRAEGDATDAAGMNNGALEGGATFALGEVGEAFSFNPASGTMIVPDSSNLRLTNQLTIEAWINARTANGPYGNAIVSKVGGTGGNNGYQFFLDGNTLAGQFNSPGGGWPSARITSGGIITTGVWYHVAWTYDQSAMKLYCNGQPVATNVIGAKPVAPSSSNLRLSGDDNDHVYFDGLIDEASVYNRALSPSEIAAIYAARSTGKCVLAPSILTPPLSQAVECSSNVTFSVTAAGALPLAYRWYFGLKSIPSATNTLLTLTNVGFAQAGNYSIVVTNVYGSITGGPAILTVLDTTPPTIISCVSNRTLSVGANCTTSLPDLTSEVVAEDASGPVIVTQNPPPGTLLGLELTNVAFTVQDSSSNASVCVSIVSVADTTPPFVLACLLELTLDSDTNCLAFLPDLTSTNYIVASDNCSSVSVTQSPSAFTAMPVGTNTVFLTVLDGAGNQTTRAVAVIVSGKPHIIVQPSNLTLAASSNATFSVLACGASSLSYQWQHFSTNLPGVTNAVLVLSNIKTNDAGDYRVVITNSAGSITSAVAMLTVLQPPVIVRQPRNVAAAPGGVGSFSVSVEGRTPLTYQWQRNGSPLEGQTNAGLTVSNVQPADFAGYFVAITNADGSALSDVAMLTLAGSPVIVSPGLNSTTFMLTVPTEVGPTYVLECKDSLEDPSWKVLTTLNGTGLPIPITDNGLTSTNRFYRVRVR